MIRTSFGIVVGRFQVHELHEGHLELINAVASRHDRVIVFLGTTPALASKRNPLDFMTRERMLKAAFPTLTVANMPDRRSNEEWSADLDRRIREIAPYGHITLYGGRDSFVPAYSGGFKPVELPLKIVDRSGEDVRAEISNRVIESPDFRAGVIYSTQNRFNNSIQTVDVAILSEERSELCIGRKAGESLWRFPGGYVDANDESFEAAARREFREETGLEARIVSYISSHRVDDWRYRKEDDKIMTALFFGVNSAGAFRPTDDLAEVRWQNMPTEDMFVEEHRPLFRSFERFCNTVLDKVVEAVESRSQDK